IFGLTRATGPAELARAALEAACYQTLDLLTAVDKDGVILNTLKFDGGMAANDWMLQFLADILGKPVERPANLETTALGAAYMAARRIGLYGTPAEFAALCRTGARFEPLMSDGTRSALVAGWHDAVRRVLTQ